MQTVINFVKPLLKQYLKTVQKRF